MSPHGFFGLVPLRPTNEISGWAPPWLVGWVGARDRQARASDASMVSYHHGVPEPRRRGTRPGEKSHRIRWIRCTLSTPSLVSPRQVGRSDRLDMDEVGLDVALGSWSGRWVGVWVGVEHFVPSIWCIPPCASPSP